MPNIFIPQGVKVFAFFSNPIYFICEREISIKLLRHFPRKNTEPHFLNILSPQETLFSGKLPLQCISCILVDSRGDMYTPALSPRDKAGVYT